MSGSVAQWRYRTKIVATIDLSFTGVVIVLVVAGVIAVIVNLLYTTGLIGPELQTSSYLVFNQSTGQWNFPANSPRRLLFTLWMIILFGVTYIVPQLYAGLKLYRSVTPYYVENKQTKRARCWLMVWIYVTIFSCCCALFGEGFFFRIRIYSLFHNTARGVMIFIVNKYNRKLIRIDEKKTEVIAKVVDH